MGKEHWIETTLKEIVISKKGKKPKILHTYSFHDSSPYIDIEAFEKGIIRQYADDESSNHCEQNDILVVWDGARFGLVGYRLKGAIGSTLACLTPILLEPSFLYRFIQSQYSSIQQKPKGMATPHVDPLLFWNIIIPLPPLNEQKRIVEKLDILLPKVKSAKARLEKIPTILKKFRQSVLTEACSGRLTENWRDEKGLQNWDNVTLKDIANVKGGITKDTGKQKSTDIELPYLRVANVQRGYLNLSEIKTIKISTEKVDQYLLQYGDILLNEGGDPDKLGRGWIWENQIEKCVHQNHVFRARLFDSRNQPKYISWYANSIGADFFLLSGKQTTGLASINKTMISNLPIMLPTFEEQQEIVHRVEKLFALADSIESKYRKAIERVEKMEQSILSMAFRGELVDPDPNDEPADQLLNRILSEKAKHESETKRNKSSQRKTIRR